MYIAFLTKCSLGGLTVNTSTMISADELQAFQEAGGGEEARRIDLRTMDCWEHLKVDKMAQVSFTIF